MGANPPSTVGYFRAGVLAVLIGALLLTIARVLRDLARQIARALRAGRIPRTLANVLSVAVVASMLVGTAQIVLVQAGMSLVNTEWSTRNNATRAGAVQPTAWERSGSPGSLVPWDTLGYQGRNFVSGGLTAAELTEANGAPAKTPIRLYVGLESAADPDDRMQLLLAELDRTGAWDRKALIIVPTTGTGWVNPTAVRAVETMFDGDTAIVATQYSYLPSWISFLSDRATAEQSGDRLSIPSATACSCSRRIADRSCISMGSRLAPRRARAHSPTCPKSASRSTACCGWARRTRTGFGAITSCVAIPVPPRCSRPTRAGCWSGSRCRRRTSTARADLGCIHGCSTCSTRRPVVWWSPRLLFQRPDWLQERPGFDRLPAMSWFPIVTFWQVTADLGNAAGVPDGHGHNYGSAVLDGWVAIAAPEGWSHADTERVRAAMEKYAPQDGPEK